MISKPISLALVYVLTICNFLILILPFLMAIVPFVDIGDNKIIFIKLLAQNIPLNPKTVILSLIFIISFLMTIYLLLDFIFGFSVRSSLKGCQKINKTKNYDFLQNIFEEVKNKFATKNAQLYIKDSNEINAFAVGGMGRKAIVLTSGLINHYITNINDDQRFLIAIRSILGHEMSHLINKDFLPGLLIITNTKITNFVANILRLIFAITVQCMSYMTINNKVIISTITTTYNISSFILNFFNRYFINGLYCFLKNFLGREIEYRSDRQSAKAFGGINMAFALSFLGNSGYFTLFSTHPATARRIRKVEVVEEKNAIIRASLLSKISNFLSIAVMPIVCFYIAHLGKIDLIIESYIYHHYPETYSWLINFWYK